MRFILFFIFTLVWFIFAFYTLFRNKKKAPEMVLLCFFCCFVFFFVYLIIQNIIVMLHGFVQSRVFELVGINNYNVNNRTNRLFIMIYLNHNRFIKTICQFILTLFNPCRVDELSFFREKCIFVSGIVHDIIISLSFRDVNSFLTCFFVFSLF